jgi:hypothetical protein
VADAMHYRQSGTEASFSVRIKCPMEEDAGCATIRDALRDAGEAI